MRTLGAFVLIFLFLLSDSTRAAALPAGEVKIMRGEVFILDASGKVVADPEGKRGRSTKVGSKFYVGETIQTKATGRVKLEFAEAKNEVVLGPNSALTIDKSGGNPKKKVTELNLARGEVRAVVKEKYKVEEGELFQVKTPNAVAGVRGTIFVSRFDQKTFKSDFATQDGIVSVQAKSGGAPVSVAPGMFASTSREGSVSTPQPLANNPELKKSVEVLSGNPESTPTPETPKTQESAAPTSREPVMEAKADSGGGRSPAGVGAPQGPENVGPKVMGEDMGPSRMDAKSAANSFSALNNYVDSRVNSISQVVQQQNQISNTMSRVSFRIQ